LFQSIFKRWSEDGLFLAYSIGLILLLLAFSDVPILTALGCAVLFLFQCAIGSFVLSCFRSGKGSLFQLFGSSFAVGALLFSMFSIVGHQLTTPRLKYIALLILIVAIGLIFRFRNKSLQSEYNGEQWIAVAFPVLIVLTFQFSWYIGPSLFLFLILKRGIGGPDNPRQPNKLLSLVIFCSGLVLLILLKTKYWWITSDDYQFFETISNSIGKWGLNENAAAVGRNVYNWHFLTYAWTGTMDEVLNADTWIILTRCTPLLSSISMISLLFEISIKLLPNLEMRSRLVGIVITSLLTNISWISPSYGFTLIWFLATVLFLIEISISSNKLRLSFLIGVFLGVTALGKVSSIPVLILLLFSLWIFNQFKNKQLAKFYFLSGLCGLFCLSIIYLLSYRYSSANKVLWLASYEHVVHRLWSGTSISVDLEKVSQTFWKVLLLPILVSVLLLNFKHPKLHIFRIWTTVSILILIIPLIFLDGWVDTVKYVTSPAYFSLTIILGLCVSVNDRIVEIVWREKIRIVAFLLFLLPILLLRDMVLSETFSKQLTQICLSVVFLISIFCHRLRLKSMLRLHKLGLISISVLIFVSFAEPLAQNLEQRISYRRHPQNVEFFIGDKYVQEIGYWLKNNSDRNSVIASNSFCRGKDCMGQFWFAQQLQLFQSDPDILSGSCSQCDFNSLFGGANFLLADYSDRRFIIQGPRFLFGMNYPPKWVIEKMDFSLSFPTLSNDEMVIKMEKFKVDYFVVDKIASPVKTYIQPNLIVFQNRDFMIIERPQTQVS
jgi:hypothetical protein